MLTLISELVIGMIGAFAIWVIVFTIKENSARVVAALSGHPLPVSEVQYALNFTPPRRVRRAEARGAWIDHRPHATRVA